MFDLFLETMYFIHSLNYIGISTVNLLTTNAFVVHYPKYSTPDYIRGTSF